MGLTFTKMSQHMKTVTQCRNVLNSNLEAHRKHIRSVEMQQITKVMCTDTQEFGCICCKSNIFQDKYALSKF